MRTSEERLYSIKQKAAERAAAQARRSAKIKFLSVIAAALCIVIAANLILFVPFSSGIPDLTRFSASEYYPLMNKINELTYTPPRYKNNFEKLIHSIQSDGNMDTGISPEPLPPTTDRPDVSVSDDENTTSPSGENDYQDVTDNQVQGVTEGDLFKRTQTHLGCAGGVNFCPAKRTFPLKSNSASIPICVPSSALHILHTLESPDVLHLFSITPKRFCDCA